MADAESASRIVQIFLDERTIVRRNPEVEHERAVAIYDLLDANYFEPIGCGEGPYILRLSIVDARLIFDIRDQQDAELGKVTLPLVPFRKIVKDYFEICEVYYTAIRDAPPSRIEAIDMGRRGLHDEAAHTLRDRLGGRIELDHDTARRLFTLVCVLHIRA